MFDEQTVVNGNLNVFDRGSLTDVRHEPVQFGFVKNMVMPQPHLREQVVIVQIVEELVSQNVHPVLIGTIDELNELAAPGVGICSRFGRVFLCTFFCHFRIRRVRAC